MAPARGANRKRKAKSAADQEEASRQLAEEEARYGSFPDEPVTVDPHSFLQQYDSVNELTQGDVDPLEFLEEYDPVNHFVHEDDQMEIEDPLAGYMSRVSYNTPGVPRAVLTPSEHHRLYKAYKGLLNMNVRPQIKCPAIDCEQVLDVAEPDSIYRHFEAEHESYSCPDCNDPPVEFRSQDHLDQHIQKGHSFEITVGKGGLQVAQGQNIQPEIPEDDTFVLTKEKLGFTYMHEKYGLKSPWGALNFSTIIRDFEIKRKRVPSGYAYCSRCFRDFPPSHEDDRVRDLQMLAHTDPVRSCGISNTDVPEHVDIGLLPNQAGWYNPIQMYYAALRTVNYCREKGPEQMPAYPDLVETDEKGTLTAPSSLPVLIRSLLLEVTSWMKQDAADACRASIFSPKPEEIECGDCLASDPNVVSQAHTWRLGKHWYPWYKNGEMHDEKGGEMNGSVPDRKRDRVRKSAAEEARLELIRKLNRSLPPSFEPVGRPRKKELSAGRAENRTGAPVVGERSNVGASTRTPSPAINRTGNVLLSPPETPESALEMSRRVEKRKGIPIGPIPAEKSLIRATAPDLRHASVSKRKEVYSFDPVKISPVRGLAPDLRNSSVSEREETYRLSPTEAEHESFEDQDQPGDSENIRPVATSRGKKRVRVAKLPHDNAYRYSSDENSEDSLEPDIDDLLPVKRRKTADPSFRPSKVHREIEAEDRREEFALQPDVDDLAPAKPRKIDDPTFRPSEVHLQIEAEDRAEELADLAAEEKQSKATGKGVASRSPAGSSKKSTAKNVPLSKSRKTEKSALEPKKSPKKATAKKAANPKPPASEPKKSAPKKVAPKKAVPEKAITKKAAPKKAAPKKPAPKKAAPAKRVTRGVAKAKG